MSELAYKSGTGVCSKCGQQLLQLEDDGSKMCVVCKSKKLIEGGLQVPAANPNEDQVNKVLAAAGISVKPAAMSASTPKPVQTVSIPLPNKGLSFDDMIGNALELMKNLPMPKDIKQFKTITKIIAQLESLLEKKNG